MDGEGEVGDYIVQILTFIRDHQKCKAGELQSLNIPEATLFRCSRNLSKKRSLKRNPGRGLISLRISSRKGHPKASSFTVMRTGINWLWNRARPLGKEWVEQEFRIMDARIVLKEIPGSVREI